MYSHLGKGLLMRQTAAVVTVLMCLIMASSANAVAQSSGPQPFDRALVTADGCLKSQEMEENFLQADPRQWGLASLNCVAAIQADMQSLDETGQDIEPFVAEAYLRFILVTQNRADLGLIQLTNEERRQLDRVYNEATFLQRQLTGTNSF